MTFPTNGHRIEEFQARPIRRRDANYKKAVGGNNLKHFLR